MSPTALFTQFIILTTGAFCLYIAIQLGKRQLTETGDRLAWSAFRIWWLALGLNIGLGAVNTLMALASIYNLTAHLILMLSSILVLCIALWGLLYYLIYLFTGSRLWAWPLAAFYGLVFVSLVAYLFFVLQPVGVIHENGSASLQYASDAPELNVLIVAIFILLPQILAALAYFSLFFRVKDRAQKYRVLLVSLSILVWFSSPFIALGLGWADLPWWSLASRLLGLAAVLAIYWAYYPPIFIQRRFGIAGI